MSCLDDDLLTRVIERKATSEELARVEAHVAGCSPCRWIVARLLSTSGGTSPPRGWAKPVTPLSLLRTRSPAQVEATPPSSHGSSGALMPHAHTVPAGEGERQSTAGIGAEGINTGGLVESLTGSTSVGRCCATGQR